MPGLLTDTVRGLKALVPLPATTSWSSRFFYRGLVGERDYGEAVGDGSNSSIVEACVLWICRNFPEAPLAVWKYGDDDLLAPVRRHPLALRVRRPNPFYSGTLLWMGTLASWVTDGNAYWLKRRDPLGRIAEFWYVPHWMMDPRGPADAKRFISHYEYRVAGDMWELAPSEVLHLRYGIDPNDPRRGRSPLRTLLREIFTDEEAARFTAALLQNFGMPGLVIAPAKDAKTRPTPDEKDAIKDRFMQSYGGDRRGEPIVMSGPSEIKQFGFSPAELDLSALRDIPEERATAVIGIPAPVVGLGPGMQGVKVGRTLEEYRDQAWESNLIPTGHLYAEEISLQVLPDFVGPTALGLDPTAVEQIEVGFDLSRVAVLQDAQLKRATIEATLLRAGIKKRSESRAALGLPVKPEDDTYLPQPGVQGAASDPAADDDGDEEDEAEQD